MSVHRGKRRGAVRTTVFGKQPLWRSALRTMLETVGVGPVTTCASLAELASVQEDALRPQLLVADADGAPEFVEHLRELVTRLPRLTTVVVSECTDLDWMQSL